MNLFNKKNSIFSINFSKQKKQNNFIKFNLDPNIPRVVYQTWKTLNLPNKMKKNIEFMKKQNPEMKFELYDDNMCRNFIKKNFNPDVLYSFDKLNPGAFKSDLWRYCILYKKGGLYLDIKMKCVNNFKLITLLGGEKYPRDRIVKDIEGIWQGLLVCKKGNKILKILIDKICNNVKNDFYGNNAIQITGPGLFGLYFKNNNIKNNTVLRFDVINNKRNSSCIYLNNTPILENYKTYRAETKQMKNNTHYSFFWKDLNVFNYPCLNQNKYLFKKKIYFKKEKNFTINNKSETFYSSNLAFIKNPNHSGEYLVNQKWVNYKYHISGYKNDVKNLITLNSFFIIDKNFNIISNNYFFNNKEIYLNSSLAAFGYEDIRLINVNDNIMCYYSTFVKFNNSFKTLIGFNKYFYNNITLPKLDIINSKSKDLLLFNLKKKIDLQKNNNIYDISTYNTNSDSNFGSRTG